MDGAPVVAGPNSGRERVEPGEEVGHGPAVPAGFPDVGHEPAVPAEFAQAESAEAGGGAGVPSAGELLALHGTSVLRYACLCVERNPGAEQDRGTAERLAGLAFRTTRGDVAAHAGADFPWRPRLLSAVLDAAREWNEDDRRSSLHPGLRDDGSGDARRTLPGGGRGSGARSLVLRAFHNLPHRAQTLLWHTVVEAEDIGAVAVLVGADPALLNPERARTLLRDECVRVHLDRARDERCRRLHRLIDVHARRGATETMAEVRDHLDGCSYCRAAVDQLDQSPERLPALLAEAVLGFRAADYLATRPARQERPAPSPDAPARASADARPEPAARPARAQARPPEGDRPAPGRLRWPLPAALGVLLCGVIAASPMALGGAGDSEAVGGSVAVPTASPSATASAPSDVAPAPATSPVPDTSPSLGGDEAPVTRLRNVRTGLCLDLRASAAVPGTPAVTARCEGAASQLWRWDREGRLRNLAAPELCLNAEPQGTVALRPCAATETGEEPANGEEATDGEESADTRYDLASDGLLTLVAEPGVAVTPVRRAEGAVILLEPVPQDRVRRSQRWLTDEGFAGAVS
ncbi:ricin-type beta-trefoil lectin domain protein [Streptomyces scabiei]|uniref:ricin-type beta-trefoil lectin domain protein n=1 Tax=Streptomyces scabiei TaxID=1930 RepID=UPI0029AFA2AE|nr:ricin-type beta-trefoil lectin domain protein [Streptomyces scabiei]MDX3519943.1 ricin-type beta-trefoil lectin domain protein [Streptomyces scabiei]